MYHVNILYMAVKNKFWSALTYPCFCMAMAAHTEDKGKVSFSSMTMQDCIEQK